MSSKFIIVTFFAMLTLGLYSQRPTLELTFTTVDQIAHVQLDSIKVMNRTQGSDTVLFWPDTVLSIYYLGVPEFAGEKTIFKVFQNYPNPVTDQTTVLLFIPEKDKLSLIVTDMLGRIILTSERVLDRGIHSFRFTPGGRNIYFFNAKWHGQSSCVKIIQAGFQKGGMTTLDYTGSEDATPQPKAMKDMRGFSFTPGDKLRYIGYTDMFQSEILDAPKESQTYAFQFTTNISCPGTPTVEYEGQVYNTIQIFNQCWLKENLNVGIMIDGHYDMQDNGVIEKYCYNNKADSCTKYGGLYQWREMMQYSTQQGSRGICPPGWHLPTDEEWKLLEGAVDSHYRIGDPEWDDYCDSRGFDAGTNLKNTNGWDGLNGTGNGNDLFGFSGLSGGDRIIYGTFDFISRYGIWWTSTQYNDGQAILRSLWSWESGVDRCPLEEDWVGLSVRCLRDY